MEPKQVILQTLRKEKLLERVIFIYIFGSQADGTATKQSDIDICICMDCSEDEAYSIQKRLSGILSQKYDIKLFQLLPLYVQAEVFKGNLIYRNGKDVYDIARKTSLEFEEFKPRYEYIVRSKAGLDAEL